jgi:hypothetical protein
LITKIVTKAPQRVINLIDAAVDKRNTIAKQVCKLLRLSERISENDHRFVVLNARSDTLSNLRGDFLRFGKDILLASECGFDDQNVGIDWLRPLRKKLLFGAEVASVEDTLVALKEKHARADNVTCVKWAHTCVAQYVCCRPFP